MASSCFQFLCDFTEGSPPNLEKPERRPATMVQDVERKNRDAARSTEVERLAKKFYRFFSSVKTNIGEGDRALFRTHQSQSTYGFLAFEGMDDMLVGEETKEKVFYDLGSGVGKPPIAAIMLFPELQKVVGIELSKERHIYAIKASKELLDKKRRNKVQLIHGSMLDVDISDADLVYISSLCFSRDFLKRLGRHLDSCLREGATVMTSKEIPLKRGRLVSRPQVS
mmetsp:Transcript_21378/g.29948  ORF Transcript_21378/g.29948 Transcript_21378/m.29948 type:complete len:225 (-) Transcript_21378:229-903(-)